MKPALLLVIILFIFISSLYAQPPINISKHINNPGLQKDKIIKTPTNILAENCSNGIDDDGNGLIDMKDFSCYFANTSPDTCIPTKVIWATFSTRLYWVDMETNTDRVINFPFQESYGDITWTPSGKLYGAESNSGNIREINPLTGQTQFRDSVPGHYFTNGMTSDSQGILYLASITLAQKWHVVKLNLSTHQTSILADLSANGLESAGDLTFLNGYLYVSCINGKLAKIDIGTGNVQTINYFNNVGTSQAFGLTTLGDGYLYLSSADEIYQLDPNTLVSTFYYHCPTYGFTFGLASYSEFCNSPVCRGKLNIAVQSNNPYCSNSGVSLKGMGTGITGETGYTWTLPNGQTKPGDTLTAFVSGKYYLRYHTLPDTCGVIDSINLNIIQYPFISLGADTTLCPSSPLILQPFNTNSITSYLWQDGSTASQYMVQQPGLYWVEGKNVCGTKKDSIIVASDTLQDMDIGIDTLLCPKTSILLKNSFPKRNSVSYIWSTGSTAENIIVTQPGTYWLQAKNKCGTFTDSIKITSKDSCICKPIFAKANFGTDKQLCKYDTLLLKNVDDNSSFRYRWQDGSGGNTFVVKQPGIYWAEISTYCNTVRDTVIIKDKTTGCECFTYIPNAFTPNSDSKNDIYRAKSNCNIKGEMRIYNRWGILVYYSTDLQKGWDGNYSQNKQPNDVYVYYLTYKFLNRPGDFSNKGTFILLR